MTKNKKNKLFSIPYFEFDPNDKNCEKKFKKFIENLIKLKTKQKSTIKSKEVKNNDKKQTS